MATTKDTFRYLILINVPFGLWQAVIVWIILTGGMVAISAESIIVALIMMPAALALAYLSVVSLNRQSRLVDYSRVACLILVFLPNLSMWYQDVSWMLDSNTPVFSYYLTKQWVIIAVWSLWIAYNIVYRRIVARGGSSKGNI